MIPEQIYTEDEDNSYEDVIPIFNTAIKKAVRITLLPS